MQCNSSWPSAGKASSSKRSGGVRIKQMTVTHLHRLCENSVGLCEIESGFGPRVRHLWSQTMHLGKHVLTRCSISDAMSEIEPDSGVSEL